VKEEYGIEGGPCKLYDVNVQYEPADYGITTAYTDLEKIYEVKLAPTIITRVTNKENGQEQIKKQLLKEKMMGNELTLLNARRECTIHNLFKHDNVVELYEYTENEDEFVLYMEYANDPNYFDTKIFE